MFVRFSVLCVRSDKKSSGGANTEVKEKSEAVQVNGETEPNNTQENGPLHPCIQPAFPNRESEPTENRAQDKDIKKHLGDSGQAQHLQCTVSQTKVHTATDLEVCETTSDVLEEENKASVPGGTLLTAGDVCQEKPSHSEKTSAQEHITKTCTDDEESGSKVTRDFAVAEPSGESFPQVLSGPEPQLSAAACQVLSSCSVNQPVNKEAQS